MAVYEITDPSGRTLEIEGDSPPNEAQLNEIFASVPAASSIEAPPAPDNSLSSMAMGAIKKGSARADVRGDLWKELPDYVRSTLEKNSKLTGMDIAKKFANRGFEKEAAIAALMGVGGASQRYEAIGANLAEQFQTGEDQYGKAVVDAIKGERLGEFGDMYMRAGLPEPLANFAGLGTSMITDPATLIKLGKAAIKGGLPALRAMLPSIGKNTAGGALGKKTREVAQSTVGKAAVTGYKKTHRNVGRFLLGHPDDLLQYADDTAYDFVKPLYTETKTIKGLKVTPSERAAKAIHKQIEKYGNDASALFDNMKSTGAPEIVNFNNHEELLNKLVDLVYDEGQLGGGSGAVNEFVRKLSTKINNPDKATTKLHTISDMMKEAKILKSYAKSDPVANIAFREVSDSLAKEFPPLAEANKAWKNYTIMREQGEKLFGRGMRTMGDDLAFPEAGKLKTYWTKPGATSEDIRIATRELDRSFKQMGSRISVETVVQNLSAAASFERLVPGLKPLVMGAYIRAIAGVPASVLTSILQGGALVGSSPKGYALMGRAGYKSPQQIKALLQANQILEPFMGATDMAIQRQLTGRNTALKKE